MLQGGNRYATYHAATAQMRATHPPRVGGEGSRQVGQKSADTSVHRQEPALLDQTQGEDQASEMHGQHPLKNAHTHAIQRCRRLHWQTLQALQELQQ